MKVLKDWRLVLFVTVILCLTPFFTDLYSQYTEQPSDGWSDGVELLKLTDMEYFNQEIYTVYNTGEGVFLGYIEDHMVNLIHFDLLGDLKGEWLLSFDEGTNITHIELTNDEKNMKLYVLADNQLSVYPFDLENAFGAEEIVANNVLDFETVDGLLAYNTETEMHTSFGFDFQSESGYDRYDLLKTDDTIHMAFVTLSGSERVLNYVKVVDGQAKHILVGTLPFNTVGDLEVYDEEGIHIIAPNRVIPRNKETYEIYVYSNLDGVAERSMRYFDTLKSFKVQVDPRPDGSHFTLVPRTLQMGQNGAAVNFWATNHNDVNLRTGDLITKSTDYSKYYDYFHNNGDEYIVFADTKLSEKTFYLSGTTEGLIAKARIMESSDYGAIFRDGIMSLILLPTMILILYSFTAVSSMVFYGTALMGPGDIVYNKPKLAKNVGIVIHSVVMIYYVIDKFINNNANQMIYYVMPEYLKSTAVIMILTFATMAASYLIVKLFNEQKFEPMGTVVSHFMFITIHVFLFAFMFYSHYAGYAILRYYLFN